MSSMLLNLFRCCICPLGDPNGQQICGSVGTARFRRISYRSRIQARDVQLFSCTWPPQMIIALSKTNGELPRIGEFCTCHIFYFCWYCSVALILVVTVLYLVGPALTHPVVSKKCGQKIDRRGDLIDGNLRIV
jgi:hypothetical protein